MIFVDHAVAEINSQTLVIEAARCFVRRFLEGSALILKPFVFLIGQVGVGYRHLEPFVV